MAMKLQTIIFLVNKRTPE